MMKKLLLIGGMFILSASMNSTIAQTQNNVQQDLKINQLKFNKEVHDFGEIPEGPESTFEFTFINESSEAVLITNAQASCGCTTPSYSKEPILPKQQGSIKVGYATNGRPGNFDKSITVTTSIGTKILHIKGNVIKAPTSSVPASKGSMIKTNY